MDTGKKQSSTGKDQPVRVGKRRQTASEMDFQTAWEKAAQKKNPNANDQMVRVGKRQQRYGRGR
jgi:hypothetical protein